MMVMFSRCNYKPFFYPSIINATVIIIFILIICLIIIAMIIIYIHHYVFCHYYCYYVFFYHVSLFIYQSTRDLEYFATKTPLRLQWGY